MSRRQASRRARKNSKESVRLALSRGLVRSLVQYGAVKTTLSRAKNIKPWVDTLVTIARLGSDVSRRRLLAKLGNDKETTQALITFAARVNGRTSGFTRIVKLGTRRGDLSSMARVEWVDKVEVKTHPRSDAVYSKVKTNETEEKPETKKKPKAK